MGNQHQNLTPSKLKYITLLSHQTNNTELRPTIGFNAFIHNNTIDYLGVDIAYLFDNNGDEFKKLIDEIDKVYYRIGGGLGGARPREQLDKQINLTDTIQQILENWGQLGFYAHWEEKKMLIETRMGALQKQGQLGDHKTGKN